ncbi:hypothetical protein GCM10010441_32720 [Kitasatospora paracochleata]|uniref:Uncharacterized protein n=1 Tax=Kitasatospora paracochleata TaxID=58354 RepID=A0ABT1IPQ9_9ACTN|nr:hypothetical protein [Kitasatospora paracochleata]MCP2307115.1 hypothetical protein [Kitasatospora paracochleata]
MSWTGLWLIGPIPDAEARDLPFRFLHLWEPGTGGPSRDLGDSLRWWAEGGEPMLEHDSGGRVHATRAAERFAALVRSAHPETPAAEALRDACLNLVEQAGTHFAAVLRKTDPATALCYALGHDAALQLPGMLGDFLLTAQEVRDSLPAAERVLDLSGRRRAEVLAGITDWIAATGDAPGYDPAELLDGPLRMLRLAAATGAGAAGLCRTY